MKNTDFIIAKSGRKYAKIPEGYDVETWDMMTIHERLVALNLIDKEPHKQLKLF